MPRCYLHRKWVQTGYTLLTQDRFSVNMLLEGGSEDRVSLCSPLSWHWLCRLGWFWNSEVHLPVSKVPGLKGALTLCVTLSDCLKEWSLFTPKYTLPGGGRTRLGDRVLAQHDFPEFGQKMAKTNKPLLGESICSKENYSFYFNNFVSLISLKNFNCYFFLRPPPYVPTIWEFYC